jgi:hypothetical protein
MDTALHILAVFILCDIVAAVFLMVLLGVLRRHQPHDQRMPLGPLLSALLFLAVVSGLVYGGIWMCLRATS